MFSTTALTLLNITNALRITADIRRIFQRHFDFQILKFLLKNNVIFFFVTKKIKILYVMPDISFNVNRFDVL